ncbi:hypothetical protein TSTA_051860 [Talaromyces stipitatus ATCC 10500]|uniref:Uncharacterized protein n=1 Tax=Talaromyces stipitatus (strain ATCC 10500 / CBS 375.48 / QM 6759 / NRRL 1006) TaxID=441959 RepID=B8MJQ0_TALSN|nr:uncharacterized protein TSTA_051860 [Talaromyces stipitatus ATCC 10500]EED15749.1 hypothetical protein TSTA_051860 [Talaromyces stipitatus ATCC 10500]
MAPNTNPNEFDPEGKNRTQRDTYVEGKLKKYKEAEDVVLWAIFKQDFEKWSLNHLWQTSFLLLSKLITLLKSNGMYVDDTKGYLITENVATAAAQREPHEWTKTEVIAHLRKGSGDSFKRKLKIFYGYCRQNGLPNTPKSYREALPHMLRDAALSYYWDNINLWIVQGKDPAEEIITRFKGPEHQ